MKGEGRERGRRGREGVGKGREGEGKERGGREWGRRGREGEGFLLCSSQFRFKTGVGGTVLQAYQSQLTKHYVFNHTIAPCARAIYVVNHSHPHNTISPTGNLAST